MILSARCEDPERAPAEFDFAQSPRILVESSQIALTPRRNLRLFEMAGSG
jgi:hypothetical protein